MSNLRLDTVESLDSGNVFEVSKLGYTFEYAANVMISSYSQTVKDGDLIYRVSGSTPLPYTTTGLGMPEGGSFVNVADAVTSVSGKTGEVTLAKEDVGLSNVDNTTDINKPISNPTQAALDNKVDKQAGKGLSDANFTQAEKDKLSSLDSNPDTNAFTDDEKAKLASVANGATANRSDSENADKVHTHAISDITDLSTRLSDIDVLINEASTSTAIIDDTAGVGDIDVTWSADKSSRELADVAQLSQSVHNVSGAMTVIDVNEAGKWVCLLEDDTSISLSTTHTGAQASVLLMQDDAGGHAVSWSDLIDWVGSNEHGRIGGQVTQIDLVKIGPDRWGASSTVYPVPPIPHVPLGALYAFAWQGQDDKVLLSIADDSQSVLFSSGMPTVMTEDINTGDNYKCWLSVSPDSQFVLFCATNDTPVRLYNTSNWSFIEIDAPYSQRYPVKIPPQIRGDWVYGYNEDTGVYRVSVVTGVRENTGIILGGYPQSLSCSDGEITLTFNMTTSMIWDEDGELVITSSILTYDINTFTLAADQFSYPDGAGTGYGGPPSPYGISGRYSVDGSMYALSASMTYDPGYSRRAELFIYDSTTKQIIQTHTFSEQHNADQYTPTWSENGKYCAVVSPRNVILVADVEANTSIEVDLSPYGNRPDRSEIMLTNDGFIIVTMNSETSPVAPSEGLNIPFAGGEFMTDPGDVIFGNFRGEMADTETSFGTNITVIDGVNYFVVALDYGNYTMVQLIVTDMPTHSQTGSPSANLTAKLAGIENFTLQLPSGEYPLTDFVKVPLGTSYAWAAANLPTEAYAEISDSGTGVVVSDDLTINDTTSHKPFITFSAVTGLEAPNWGGSVYGIDAGQLGLIIGSNQ